MAVKLVEVGLAYSIGTRRGFQFPPSEPCIRCGTHGNHVERKNGRAAIVCDGCGKHAPIIFK